MNILNFPQKTIWSGLTGCADALLLAQTIQKEKRLLVIVTPDSQTALRLEHELAFFLGHDDAIVHFPDWEILPYDIFSPLPELVSERLKTLALLPTLENGALIVPINTLMHRLVPLEHILKQRRILKVGEIIACDFFENLDYQSVSQVSNHGEFVIHQHVADIFPLGSVVPFRLELEENKILSIRPFDVETQRAIHEKITEIALFPVREFPTDKNAIQHFQRQFLAEFSENAVNSTFYKSVLNSAFPNGIEYYAPLFVEKMTTLLHYVADSAMLVYFENMAASAHDFYREIETRYQQEQTSRLLLAPEKLFLSPDELAQKITAFEQITLCHDAKGNDFYPLPDVSFNHQKKQPLAALQHFVNSFEGRILFVAESTGHRETLRERLRKHSIHTKLVENWQQFLNQTEKFCLVIAPLDEGIIAKNAEFAIISQSQLLGEKAQQRRRRKIAGNRELTAIVNNLNELTLGAPVVHIEHGVGRYLGLQTLSVGAITSEFLTLEYANQDKLYVPVSALQMVTRYTGMSVENAPLHKLGGDIWRKAKQKTLARVRDVASELLDIYAKRAAKQRQQFEFEEVDYVAFANGFPFEETPDQQQAIDNIIDDFKKPQPMDRVICGDVGFGKTEVAMRAAFIAVQSGKQVAVLVPTTLLAQQHYANFCDRFADWAVKIELMSRFVTQKQQNEIKQHLENGIVDILIGTHKLLSSELRYKNLGLVIIDEEHRFGVQQKEHFKKMRHEIDMLTLTATPIPRTLNMAMSGLREISIIATPPPNRHAIKTFINEWDDAQIREACQREIKRGGQIFFLHNDIKSMEKMARDLEKLVPEAKIDIAHGQMHGKELEKVMLNFYHKRFNLLLSTTIIESGIDIPNANTIIINRADKLGLAPLHQLRGRVGRSHHRAYAYFIVPPKALMTEDAVKRLEAIEAAGDLGAGFMLSTHDLEIRGAGELLGDGQSGQIQEIGFTLYAELLERAVDALKKGETLSLENSIDKIEVDLQETALIPEDYLADVHARLVWYKRIANAKNSADLHELKMELVDRFGLLPEPLKTLFSITDLKQRAEKIGIKKIEINAKGGRFIFTENPSIDVGKLILLIQSKPNVYKLDGMDKLRVIKNFDNGTQKIEFIMELLRNLI